MPVYKKKTLVTDPRFSGRVVTIMGMDSVDNIHIPDAVVLCNGCNRNIAEAEVVNGEIPSGYLIYLGKRELKADAPYDIYCPSCTNSYFPKAEAV